jgi:hypothetical protein
VRAFSSNSVIPKMTFLKLALTLRNFSQKSVIEGILETAIEGIFKMFYILQAFS